MSSRRTQWASAEMITAVAAVVIGACALVVAFVEVRIMRADQRSAVLPMLELSRSYYQSAETGADGRPIMRLTMNAENVGIGPARVVDFRVTVDGKPYPTWGAAVQALLGEDVAISYGHSTIRGRTLPAGRSVDMFSLRDRELAARIYENFEGLDFEACFCSVFDECWTTSFVSFGSSTAVDACRTDEDSFTQ